MAYTTKSYSEILSDLVTYIVANSSNINDLSPGSVIRSYCEGAALSIEEFYVSVYLGFRRYLKNIPASVFDFPQKSGTKASTNVVFSRTGTSGIAPIPAGTRVKTPSGLRFLTTAAGEISDTMTDSAAIEAEAESVGTAYNVSASSITIIEDSLADVETVTNAAAAVNGVNKESDIAYQARFQLYLEGLAGSNVAGLKAGALGVEGITSVSAVELFPPVSDVNVDLYIDDGSSGGVSSAKIAEVQVVIDGDGTEDNPGYRAAGINVEVKAPSTIIQNITATITVIAGVDTDQLQTDAINALTKYINTLGVGESIIYNEIVAAFMSVFGIADVDVTVPAANVTVASNQVGRIGSVTLLGI